jgi:hypothetical protein
MKKNRIIPILLLLVMVAAGSCHRNNRKVYKERSAMMEMRHSFRPGAGFHGMMPGRRPEGLHPGGMRGGIPMMMDSIDMMPFGLGKRLEESIPNVTESQKKQISELMKKHQEEMKQLHEEIAVKMKNIMTTHRNEILKVLTDEQKKYLGNPEEVK